jgi:hypothetical protein
MPPCAVLNPCTSQGISRKGATCSTATPFADFRSNQGSVAFRAEGFFATDRFLDDVLALFTMA